MAKKDKLQKLREEQERLLLKIKQAVEDNYSSMLNVPGVKQAVSDGKVDFFFSQNGAVNKAIGRIIDRMAKKMNATLLNGVERHWEQGVNNLWDDLEAANAKTPNEKKAFDQIRERATQSVRNNAKSFYNEKRAGLSVSDRVWNLAGNSKKEMEIIIQKGIQEGKTVEEIQKGLKQYLNDPDKLFRRVVNKETGELELSKAAKKYKPGRGVYRSAYKNAMRLARTEMNAAYRQAEWESYQNNPLIVGYKIMLSNNHTTLINGVPTPFHCICDDLQGEYPKSFKWLGWHPQCRCTMSPILITQPERKDLYKSIFDGKRKDWKPKQITEYPKAFTDWIDKNKDRQNDWSSTPYFIRDNFKDGLLANGLNVAAPVSTRPIKTDQQKADIQARWNARVAGRKHGGHLTDLRAKYGKESDTIARMIIQIRNQITKGLGLSDIDKMVSKLNHKVQVKIAWDERLLANANKASSKLDDIVLLLDKSNVKYNEVRMLKKELTEEDVIERIGGGDMTKGSCSSLAFAYAGNKSGFDVLDFRDGTSRQVFSRSSTIMDIAQKAGGNVVKHVNDFTKANELLKSTQIGKEYYFTCGAHAAIVRRTTTGFEYLELQSAISNGFKPLNNNVLKQRFGAKKSRSTYGMKIETYDCIIDINLLKKDPSFRKVLGYINTNESEQRKGVKGRMR